MDEMRKKSNNLSGTWWIMLSVVTASVMTLGARGVYVELDSRMLVILRAIGGIALVGVAMGVTPQRVGAIRFSSPWLHILRGAMVGCSTHLGFYAIGQMPLATATVLFFSAPIWTTLFAPMVLGERVGPRRWAAVLVGFIGVLIVVRPGSLEIGPPVFAALGSSALFAAVLLMSRKVANRDGPWATYLSSVAVTVVLSLPVTLPIWHVPVSGYGWFLLAVVTLSSMIRNIADIQAYRVADASFLAPLSYLRLIIIAIAAYFWFNEVPDAYTWVGGAVIICAALYIARREAVQNR
jgi:drug/metabolite transporter (DMT)-like permease